MFSLIRRAVVVLALVGLAILLRPQLESAYRFYRLVNAEHPSELPIPVSGIKARVLRDSWGNPRSGGRTHEGIDIFASRGTPVVSATKGFVARKGVNRLGGRVVTVIGPGGYRHYYAHLEDWSDIAERSWVAPGDVLGYVGDTGNAKGGPTHLHYGIFKPGTGAINPYPFLKLDAPQTRSTESVEESAFFWAHHWQSAGPRLHLEAVWLRALAKIKGGPNPGETARHRI